MNDQIKNRVVGTTVLFTLAIIFLPDIFDGKKNELKEEFAVIPAKPVVSMDTVQQDIVVQQPAQASQQSVVEETVVAQQSAPKSVPANTKKKPVFKKAGWVIQMGIFKQASSVAPYLKKLRAKGFNAFSIPTSPKTGESTTIYIGPELNKASLVKLQPKLKAAFNEAGYIKMFNPTPNQE